MSRRAAPLLFAALSSMLPGCAWANRDNRPVWNAFEDRIAPEDDVWFVVLLPITVPAGFVAILLDTFLVHPAQGADDAWGDASDLWRGLEWEQRYYTELAALPIRAVGTPTVFAGSFLGRSMFDWDPYEAPLTEAELRERESAAAARHAERWSSWFALLASGATSPPLAVPAPPWSHELEKSFQAARREAAAPGRVALYAAARQASLPPIVAEPWMGLDDPDPVVRYLVLRELPEQVSVPRALQEALRQDASEMVRRLAGQRWP